MKKVDNHYIPDERYDALVERLIAIPADCERLRMSDVRTEIVAALGEIGGVWPDGARPAKITL